MAYRVQFIRHTTAQADAFVGLEGEMTVDLDNDELRIHDGSTVGGVAQARKDLANVAQATTSVDGKMSAAQVTSLLDVIAGLAQELLDRAAGDTAAIASAAAYTDLETAARVIDVDAEETARIAADALLIPLTQRNAANGVATLDAGGKVVETALLADAITGKTFTSTDDKIDNFPAGTKMLFINNAAPAGWVFDSTNSDRTLLGATTAVQGGDVGGTWTIAGLTQAAHTHAYSGTTASSTDFATVASGAFFASHLNHSHTYSGTTGAATPAISSSAAWRPLYVKYITCTKS